MASRRLLGWMLGSYRCTGFPRRSIRNFVKFHGIYGPLTPSFLLFRNSQMGGTCHHLHQHIIPGTASAARTTTDI